MPRGCVHFLHKNVKLRYTYNGIIFYSTEGHGHADSIVFSRLFAPKYRIDFVPVNCENRISSERRALLGVVNNYSKHSSASDVPYKLTCYDHYYYYAITGGGDGAGILLLIYHIVIIIVQLYIPT